MHESEMADLSRCASCGAEIFAGVDRAYSLTPDASLCFDCALSRGGAYDETEDRWLRAPDESDLRLP